MNISQIRRIRLRAWFAHRTLPEKEKSYLSQLMSGKASFGEKAARRLENTYGMPAFHLDSAEEPAKVAENVAAYGIEAELADLVDAWKLLLPEEREHLMAEITRLADHNRAVRDQFLRDSGATVVNVNERRKSNQDPPVPDRRKNWGLDK